MSAQLKELRESNGRLSNSLAQLQSEHTQLQNQHSGLTLSQTREIDLLTSRLSEVEADRDALKGWERRAKGLSINLEEEKRRTEEGRRKQEDGAVDRQVDDTVRQELKRRLLNLGPTGMGTETYQDKPHIL